MGTAPNGIEINDRLSNAATQLRRERRRTADELEALREFEDRVRAIAVEQAQATPRTVGLSTASTEHRKGLREIENAYKATVMSVPHYLDEYGDSYVESLAGEFTPDIAAALTDGTEFNGRCKGALLSATSNAQSVRESLLGTIDRERESLHTATEDLEPLIEECAELDELEFDGMRFGSLDAHRARLDAMCERCEKVSDGRQDAIFDQRRVQRLPAQVPDVAMYFYQNLNVDYPVMSVIADLLDSIAAVQRRIEREIAYCRA
jgi:DNA repair exonuclease SbcCD ATPase subunit